MGKMVQRIELIHLMNVGTKLEINRSLPPPTPPTITGTPTWAIFGQGHPNLSTSYNPETETYQWINQKSGTTILKNYAPSIGTEQIAHKGDPIYDFVDKKSWNLSIGDAALTDILEVRAYNAASLTDTSFPARLFEATIWVDNEGDAATDPLSRAYNIGFNNDPIFGTFNPVTKIFIPSPAA